MERDNRERYFTMNSWPKDLDLEKKMTLLRYFRNYMNDHLLKAGANMVVREGDELARLPCLRTWFRTRSAIVLHMTNGTLQINFFQVRDLPSSGEFRPLSGSHETHCVPIDGRGHLHRRQSALSHFQIFAH